MRVNQIDDDFETPATQLYEEISSVRIRVSSFEEMVFTKKQDERPSEIFSNSEFQEKLIKELRAVASISDKFRQLLLQLLAKHDSSSPMAKSTEARLEEMSNYVTEFGCTLSTTMKKAERIMLEGLNQHNDNEMQKSVLHISLE